MGEELQTMLLDLARAQAPVPERERTLLVAVHAAIVQGSIDPLYEILEPLGIACIGVECDRASHPDGDGRCALCEERHLLEQDLDYDHLNNQDG